MEDGEGSGDREELDTQNKNKGKIVGEPHNVAAVEQTGSDDTKTVVEDMDLGEMDLKGIDKACDNPKTRYIPFSQIVLLKKAIIKTKGV